jgi:maltooligosyltrehalose trehalohydrolase
VAEIADAVHALGRELGRELYVIAETDENDRRYLLPPQQGGFGVEAVWSDDFHHALHTLLTDERQGYYQDFGKPELLARVLNEGFAFQGEPFRFWEGRPRGTPSKDIPLYRHVICTQNHDQVGNRAQGERLTALAPRGARKLAAAVLLLAPHTPLLFMGQEYDEEHPFQFFTDYGDPVLQKAVSEGRRKEFEHFSWDEVPEPQAAETFARSKLQWNVGGRETTDDGRSVHAEMLQWHRSLLELRRRAVVAGKRTCRAEWRHGALMMQVPANDPRVMVMAAFPGSAPREEPAGWRRLMSSNEDGCGVEIYEKL